MWANGLEINLWYISWNIRAGQLIDLADGILKKCVGHFSDLRIFNLKNYHVFVYGRFLPVYQFNVIFTFPLPRREDSSFSVMLVI